ncbi:MAG: hypothetical protein V1872_07180 [bacterium]
MKIGGNKAVSNVETKDKIGRPQKNNEQFEEILVKAKDDLDKINNDIKTIQLAEVKRSKDLWEVMRLFNTSIERISTLDKNILMAYNNKIKDSE